MPSRHHRQLDGNPTIVALADDALAAGGEVLFLRIVVTVRVGFVLIEARICIFHDPIHLEHLFVLIYYEF